MLISGSIGGLSLGLKYVRAHIIGVPEINISTFSTVMLGVCVCLMLYLNLVNRWEDNFDSLPWKQQQNTPREKLLCPFTGWSAGTHDALQWLPLDTRTTKDSSVHEDEQCIRPKR